MSFGVTILMDQSPREVQLERMLDLLADINAQWFLEAWKDGQKPPRSAREAGVLWRPDRPADRATFPSVSIVYRDGVASCGPIAAISVGYQRAVEVTAGRTPAETRARHRIELIEQRPSYWHAYHQAPWGLLDPTKEMQRT